MLKIFWVLTLVSAAFGLAGCMSTDQRIGIDPVIDATKVEESSASKNLILRALAKDSGTDPDVGPVNWYLVTEAGFNYVDDQCREYFDNLFFLDRKRDRIKTGLIAAGQTAAAILSVTGASTESLAIAAQAFGFSASATDIVAGSFLFSLPPSTTQGFVQRLQLAFRDAASQDRASITNPTRAYYMIQRYLDLCLPPRIETEIGRQIASARAFPVRQGIDAFSVETVSAPANDNPGPSLDRMLPPPARTLPLRGPILAPAVVPTRKPAVSSVREPVRVAPGPDLGQQRAPSVVKPDDQVPHVDDEHRPRVGVPSSDLDQPVPRSP